MKKINNQYGHKLTKKDFENRYKLLSGEKKAITKKQKEELEASYFSMCLLLPENIFLELTEVLGGLQEVLNDNEKIKCLSRCFAVEEELIKIRIKDLSERKKENEVNNVKIMRKNRV